MEISILGGLQRDKQSMWALAYLVYNYPPPFLHPLGPRATWNSDLA